MEKKDIQTLSARYGKKGYIITLALATSFIFNILALCAPFTKLGQILSSGYSCTLPYSVYLMWIEGLYGISLLIIGFSILFPFAKLSILSYVWLKEKNPKRRHKLLSTVEPLGKWSMLDVFATCIILVLCSDQILVYGTPMIGVDFFLSAIFISMVTSIVLSHLHAHTNKENLVNSENLQILSSFSKKTKVLLLFISIISFLAYILAIWCPYIQINSFLLSNYSYSIYGSIMSISSSSMLLAVFMAVTLIVFPLLHILSIMIFFTKNLFSSKTSPGLVYLVKLFSRFNMLDVFLLAFVIFISEGEKLIKTNQKNGLYLICIFTFTSLILPYLVVGLKVHLKYLLKRLEKQA